MTFLFSKRSRENLRDIHPDLVACVVACLYRYTTVDFAVIDGKRTIEEQREYVNEGVSWSMDSKHLIQDDGWAHAVDLAPWVDGDIPWSDPKPFADIARAMEMAAKYLQIDITWGGNWDVGDLPHYQLEV